MTAPQSLTINGDFQCWQRGTSFEKSDNWKYTADMWMATCGVEKVDNGVKLIFDGTMVGSSKRTFQQFIPDSKRFKDKKASIGISIDGKNYEIKGNFLENQQVNGVQQTIDGLEIALGWSDSKQMYVIILRCGTSKTVLINYVDLFEGDVAYKHQKEDYSIALMRCQQYIIYLKGIRTAKYYDKSYLGFSFPCTMKSKPMIAYKKITNTSGQDVSSQVTVTIRDDNSGVRGSETSSENNLALVYNEILITCEPL